MERRKLLLHINPEEDETSSTSSSVSRLLIECPRILYTAFCFILFLSTCLFLLILFVILLLMHNDINNRTNRDSAVSNAQVATTKTKPTTKLTTTSYQSKQSMMEYLRGLRKGNTTSNNKKSKNLTQTCFNLIQSDDEFHFNNLTKNNIYFTKSADEVIDEKFACTIESCLYLNPYKTVFILNFEPNENNGRPNPNANSFNTSGTVGETHFNYLKSFYKNLKSKDIRSEAYFRGSPFENVDKFIGDTRLLKAMIDLITFWKYSGLVNSKQNLLLSRSFYNQSTILMEKSVLYSSYAQICSPVIEKLLLTFKTLTSDFRNSGDLVDSIVNSAIDNVTDECGDCDLRKLSLFQVCTVLKPSCYFINIEAVWKTNKMDMVSHCPKVLELVMSNANETKSSVKKPPVFV